VSVGAAVAVGAVAGLLVGIGVSVATGIPLMSEAGLALGAPAAGCGGGTPPLNRLSA
jgi:hypothetical protein